MALNRGGLGPEPSEAITLRSMQEEVYLRLRQLIFDRDPEAKVWTIRELAGRFGVSAMPVREALRRLEAEGLVDFSRSRGIVVSQLSLKQVEDTFEIRLRLEPFAGRKAASRVTDEILEELQTLYNNLEDFSDGDRWRANNARFHMTIVGACGIPRLASIIDNLWLAVEPYRRYYIRDHRLLKSAQTQHRELLRLLRERDGREVEKVLERHLTMTLEAILEGMNRNESAAENEP